MSFETEAEMKETAKDRLPEVLNWNAIEVVPEFDYGPGRTDLVLVNVSEPYWKHRTEHLDLDKPIAEKNHLISFLQLQGQGPITERSFYDSAGLKNRYKRQSLKWLKDQEFVIETDDGKIRTAPNLRRHITTSIAVELKLSKWKKAIQQASRGGSFAHYKYVAMDEEKVAPALKNIEEFKSRNVGLISIDSSGNCEKHYEPDRNKPHSDFYRWELNETTLSRIA